jgi:hypothetical protein
VCMSLSNRTKNLIMCRCGCIAGVDVHIIEDGLLSRRGK